MAEALGGQKMAAITPRREMVGRVVEKGVGRGDRDDHGRDAGAKWQVTRQPCGHFSLAWVLGSKPASLENM